MKIVVTTSLLIAAAVVLANAYQQPDPWPPPGVIATGEPGLLPPRPIHRAQPVYPAGAMRVKVQGIVVIACVIDVDGSMKQAHVIQSVDKRFGLDQAALDTAQQWQFIPGEKDGHKVPVAITFHLVYALRDLPVPSTWPEYFVSSGEAIDNSGWTNSHLASQGLQLNLANPGGFVQRMSSVPQFILTSTTEKSVRSISYGPITQVPGDVPLPLPLARLDAFGSAMQARNTSRYLDTLGVGQCVINGRWWVWLAVSATFQDGD